MLGPPLLLIAFVSPFLLPGRKSLVCWAIACVVYIGSWHVFYEIPDDFGSGDLITVFVHTMIGSASILCAVIRGAHLAYKGRRRLALSRRTVDAI